MKIAKYALLITIFGTICSFNLMANRLKENSGTAPNSDSKSSIPSVPTGKLPPVPTSNIPGVPGGKPNVPGVPGKGAPPLPNLKLPTLQATSPQPSGPVSKYSLLHWEKIPSIENTFWAGIKTEDLPKLENKLFDDYFLPKAKAEVNKDKDKDKNTKVEVVKSTFVDEKVAFKMSILLTKIPVIKIIIEAFNTMDDKKISFSNLKDLSENYINLDTNNEYKSAVQEAKQKNPNIKEEEIEWRKDPEMFLIDLHKKIKNFGLKAVVWQSIWSINLEKDSITSLIDEYVATLNEIKASKRFATLLKYILVAGNILNGNHEAKGNAKGFRLKILTTTTKGTDGNNLLYHIIEELIKKDSTFKGLSEDFKKLSISKAEFQDVETTFNELQKTFKKAQTDYRNLINKENEKEEGDQFFEKAKASFSQIETIFADIEKKFKAAKEEFENTLKFYGYDIKKDDDKKLFLNIKQIINAVDSEFFKIQKAEANKAQANKAQANKAQTNKANPNKKQ